MKTQQIQLEKERKKKKRNIKNIKTTLKMPNLKISFNTEEVLIQDKFTLIRGKFKNDVLANYKNDFFLKISEDLKLSLIHI